MAESNPAGLTRQYISATGKPHNKPAPRVVARDDARTANSKPYMPPSTIPVMREARPTGAPTMPPRQPTATQMRIDLIKGERMVYSDLLCERLSERSYSPAVWTGLVEA